MSLFSLGSTKLLVNGALVVSLVLAVEGLLDEGALPLRPELLGWSYSFFYYSVI
jgi:hypothetical protein